MRQNFLSLLSFIILLTCAGYVGADQTVQPSVPSSHHQITLRLGEGGYTDDRSDIGKIGGGQATLIYQPKYSNVAISYSNEHYTNSPEPSHSYEIASMNAVNIVFYPSFNFSDRMMTFMSIGPGWYTVPINNTDPIGFNTALGINGELGSYIKLYKALKFYGLGKYLQVHNDNLGIEFEQWALLFGFSYTFNWQ